MAGLDRSPEIYCPTAACHFFPSTRDCVCDLETTPFFHVVSNSLLTNHPVFRHLLEFPSIDREK